MADVNAAETPPRVRDRRARAIGRVLQADNVLEGLILTTAKTSYCQDVLLNVRRLLHQTMADRLDGRTFGRGDIDVLWASEVTDDLANFLQATEKSTFTSQHEERWPGIGALYCESFVHCVSGLRAHIRQIETVNGALAARHGGESVLR